VLYLDAYDAHNTANDDVTIHPNFPNSDAILYSYIPYLYACMCVSTGRSVQKIITIPAGMQGVLNPCPRVLHPVWVKRLLADKFSSIKQMSIKTMFGGLIAGAAATSSSGAGPGRGLRGSSNGVLRLTATGAVSDSGEDMEDKGVYCSCCC
jgi:hypothetical protein